MYGRLYTMSSKNRDTRTRILEQTWRLMEARRGREVSIESIARAAGVSRQAVYLHFGSRAELLVATVRYADEKNDLASRVRAISESPTGGDALDRLVEFWGGYVPDIYGLARALLASRETDPDAAAAWEDRMKVFREGCRRTADALAQEGVLAPEWNVRASAGMMWALLSVSVWENLTIDLGWSAGEYVARMKTALRRVFVRNS